MKHFNKHTLPRIAALILCVVTAASSTYAAPTKNWQKTADELSARPLTVSWNSNGAVRTVDLVGVSDGFLSFKVGNQAGEASMPLDTLGDIWFNYKVEQDYSKAVGSINKETLTRQYLDLLRQTGYPMVRFLEVPPANCSFAQVVSNLTAGLLQLKQLEEATYLINQLDIVALGPEFEEHTIQLASLLVEAGNTEQASTIIQKVPIERIDLSNTDLVFDLAHLLRSQDDFGAAKGIYQKLAENPNIEDNSAIHWSYYCGLKQGDFTKDHNFAERVETIKPGAANYPLQQLVLGIYYSEREQTTEAMRSISQGIAFASPVEAWTPELMFCSAKAYENVDMPEISKSVYEETMRFFPNSTWATAAKKELEN